MNNRQDELNIQIRAQVRRITAAEMSGLRDEPMIALKRRLRELKEEYKAATQKTYQLVRTATGEVIESTTDYRRANTYYACCEANPTLSVKVVH
jgi:hypothetical protein